MTRSALLLLAVAALCGGCASRLRNTTQTPPVLAQNETQGAATAKPGSSAADANQDLLKQGYRPVQMRGETHYCRKEMLTGSRFASQVCLTEDQINTMHKAREMQFVPAPCTNTNCHQ